jgi:hypothetical protein
VSADLIREVVGSRTGADNRLVLTYVPADDDDEVDSATDEDGAAAA